MKRVGILLVVIFALIVGITSVAVAQKVSAIAEVDSMAMLIYDRYRPKMEQLVQKYNGEKDSVKQGRLAVQFDKLQAKCDVDMLGYYASNINIEGVTARIFSFRMAMSKSQLTNIYDRFSKELKQNDPFVRSLRSHIDTYQVGVGDTLGDFRAVTSRGHQFSYAEFKNEKDMLLIFGSVNELEAQGRLMLQVAYRDLDYSRMEVATIFDHTDNQSFLNCVVDQQIVWLSLCDFKGVHSPLRIAFGVQSTPMCFYISKGGCVEYISQGVDEWILQKIEQNSRPKR